MRVAFLLLDYGRGGVERMVINTASALAREGCEAHLLVSDSGGPYLDEVESTVTIHDTGANPRAASLARQLKAIRPDIAISAKLADDRLLADAVAGLAPRPRILFRVGNPIGHRLSSRNATALRRWWRLRALRLLYRRADACIAVSRGIADDLAEHVRVPEERIHVLPNPTITDELFRRSEETPAHPWLREQAPPVVLAAGGLRQQKDFGTLIRAFAQVRGQLDCRLVILGEGRQRERLLSLGRELGVDPALDLPGWMPNPHACMRRAAVYALSSRWEGSPNALVEAAALGTPVVATDCISGPREILDGGRYGGLVSVGDVSALAGALLQALMDPPTPEWTRAAAAPYHAGASARAYMTALEGHVRR